ncbi:amino acid adenylation domain-containing protein [Heliobacterium chlorum]|uniref:Amino acid adenylation domain-containing protein n=1 Tax=Heliobacterium chlorum TaxID=2698 RepID=A0ABR7SYG9_HELCL|nr:non-ribosomal peptide synthetase/type I polyketide synthase [Heliobacterium chlorum]MBC9783075.1 amino acid adenylation domain-containing protein [Heliobacterium chlorum]
MCNELSRQDYEPIAIIGMGCRLPGGINSPDDYWEVLKHGKDCLTEIPESRWSLKFFYSSHSDKPGKMIIGRGGFISGQDEFDPQFFGIVPREAEYLDPQQRKLLEVAWEALEDAGQKPSELAGKPVGVFVGAFTLDYKILQFGGRRHDNLAANTAVGLMMTMISNRISYIFDFRGPSISLDTACSSSMTAIHLACESIRSGESSMALAGGVMLQSAPQYTTSESKGGFMSPTGTSHGFDASANGYVRSEGVGLVVLKKLSEALKDGDPIYAVIMGEGANQDGHTNGITVPNPEAQKELILKVCQKIGIEPGNLQYVEAHGTGTPVGDPIEANALGEVLGIGRKAGEKCYVGSVKSNIGHTESAAGVAGLMKTALSLKNRQIPPHLHLKEINPKIKIDQWPYEIPTSLVPWPEHEGPARAGVNSFGFGGANAYAVLQEAPEIPQKVNHSSSPKVERPAILALSTRDPEVLQAIAEKYKAFLSREPCPDLNDIGYTLGYRRETHEHRLSIVYSSKEDLLNKLDSCIAGEENPYILKGRKLPDTKRKLMWVFTGMGPQWWAMGRELYLKEPVFREVIDRCDIEFAKHRDWSLVEELIHKPESESKMAETWLSQPANFAIQVALCALWRSFGIKPDGIVGHSTGEAAAFYEAGVYTFEDAVKVVIHRSRLQQTLSGTGKMVAVGLPEAEVLEKLKPFRDKISIAAVNSPRTVTISGNEQALIEFIEPLQASGVFCKFLQVQIPFHSSYMEPIKEELLECIRDIRPMKAKVPLFTTGAGEKTDGTNLDAAYWWLNIRGTVLFAKAINQIIDDEYNVFLEVGPHPVLAGSISECLEDKKQDGKTLCSLKRKDNEQERIISTLAEMHNLGFTIDWNIFYAEGNITRLPTYPWRKDLYWTEPEDVQRRRKGLIDHPLLGFRQYTPSPSWEMGISTEQYPYLRDHRIQGNVVFPGAGYIEMALSAAKLLLGNGMFAVDDLEIQKALFISDDREPRVQFLLDENNATFRIATYNDDTNSAIPHASGKIRTVQSTRIAPELHIEGLKMKLANQMEADTCYQRLHAMGYEYDYFFQAIKELWLSSGEVLAKIQMREELPEVERYYFHPTMLDACFQTLIAAEFYNGKTDGNSAIRLPVSVGRIRVADGYRGELWAHAKITESTAEKMAGDIYLYDGQGNPIGEIKDFIALGVDQASGAVSLNTIDNALYQVNWEEKERPAKENKDDKKSAKDNVGWLIFADEQGVADDISALLKKRGEQSLLIYPSDQYEWVNGEGTAKIVPDSKEQIISLIKSLFKDKGKKCKGMIHLWSLNAPTMENTSLEELQKAKGPGCYSIISIAKAISETSISTKLWVITRGAQAVEENCHDICVAASPVWGLGSVLGQQELVENWGGLIDLDPANGAAFVKEDALKIYAEITDSDSEDLIAFRNEKRLVPRINPVSGLTKPLPTKFKANGCYLVTGAFGALGQLVCRMMVKHGVRRIILMARTRIPPRTEWSYITQNDDVYEKIAFIKELERLGAEVILASVDIGNESQVAEYFKQFKRLGYPPIRGVVHSAGIVNDIVVTQMNTQSFDVVYDTKVYGSYLLHKYLLDEPIEHFVMFSSVAALVTTSGQTNYAAGNAFLDALAHYRRSIGLPALSVNWGPWAVGMIKELNLIDHYKNRRGMNCTLPQVGMSILDRVMGQDVAQVIACEADWPKVLAWYPKEPAIFSHLAKKDPSQDTKEEISFATLFRTASLERRTELVNEHLIDLIVKVLRCKRSQIEPTTTLNMMGLDSIMATELRNKISFYFGYTLSIVKLLSGATIPQLAEELVKGLLESLGDEESDLAQEEVLVSVENAEAGRSIDPLKGLEVEDEYPLSYGQKAIWFINQLMPDSPAYNISGALHIPAKLDVEALRKAIRDIIQRYPALRTNFFIKDGEPYQRVYATRKEDLQVIQVEGKEWEEIRALIIADSRKPFNLEKDPLYRIRLYQQGDESYYFAVTIYHIISDAWSNYMFIDEMQMLYDKYANDKEIDLEPITVTYKDFIDLENRMVNTSRATKMFNYWRNHLPQEMPVLNLPIDKPRPVVMTNNGASISVVLSAELSNAVKDLSKSTGATLFMTLLSAFYTLLHKYTAQEDIIIGTPVAGRSNPKFAKVYGYFVNMLPLWTTFKGDPTFNNLLKTVQNNVLMGLENQEYPYALLVDRLGLEHDASRSAVFQAMFVYLFHKVEQTGMDENNVAYYTGFPMRLLDIPEEEGQYEITLSMHEENGKLHAIFKYNTDLFYESTIQRMADHFKALLEDVTENPDKHISEMNILTSQEMNIIMDGWNSLREFQGTEECIHQIIEKVAAEKPLAVAVTVPYEDGTGERLTYQELNQRANRLARYLRERGVKANTTVGVCLDKSVDLIVSLLALMKAGGTYIPIDPEYPVDRIKYILDHSGSEYMISKMTIIETLNISKPIICMDRDAGNINSFEATNLENINVPSDLVYVVYTSGSTGQPKGAKIAHKSLASIYRSWEKEYRLKEDTSAHLQMASISFDVFAGDLVRALCSGGKLVLCRREILLNIPLLYKVITDEGIDCAEFVPSIMRNLVKYMQVAGKRLDCMKVMIVGSDVWTVDEFNRLKSFCNRKTRVINSYGLSEASIDSTYFDGDTSDYESGSTVPIGKPFPNSQVYILDQSMNPVPVGVAGEMYIGGQGLAEGYLNDEQLTAERFIEHSFFRGPLMRLYKTGDMAKWDDKGNIHILQRVDNQVKIRGNRIELGEIEKNLANCPGVISAVAVAKTDRNGDKVICAYYIPEETSPIDVKNLQKILSEKLPSYMIPEYFIEMKEFPHSPNGKIDLNALPAPEFAEHREDIVEPNTMYEKRVADVWKRLLGIQQVGLRSDFFNIGGNSLYLIELMIHLQDEFKIKLTVNQLFKASTLEGMAKTIENIVTGKQKGAEPYIEYNPGCKKVMYGFPPAGGYSLVYKNLADSMKDVTLVAFNYLTEEGKLKDYADMITAHSDNGPYVLFGYSLGGNLAFEVAKELEERGYEVSDVIIMDSYRITGTFKPTEADLKKFEYELAEHFKKHTGSAHVQKHTLEQARNFIDFCYNRTNEGNAKARVHFIIEENDSDPDREHRKASWDGSSHRSSHIYDGFGRHADMLDAGIVAENVKILRGILL